MDEYFGNLSEETLDLHSSFDSASEYEHSFSKSHLMANDFTTLNYTKSGSYFRRSQENGVKENAQTYIFDNSSIFLCSERFEGLSIDDGTTASVFKIKELKQAMLNVNDKYLLWKISEFFLKSCQANRYQISNKLAAKITEITSSSTTVQPFNRVRSKHGGSFNILGLDNADIGTQDCTKLSSFEANELKTHALKTLKDNIQRLSAERNRIKALMGVHCVKVRLANSILCEEREQQAEQRHSILQKVEQASQLVVSSNRMMQQLAHLVLDSDRKLQTTSFNSLRDKATALHCVTSILKLNMDQSAHVDVNRTRSLNLMGNNLKTSVESLSEQRKSLQKILEKYEKKEETSKRFKEIVLEYGKVKRQLQHKLQTLAVLNDPDISF